MSVTAMTSFFATSFGHERVCKLRITHLASDRGAKVARLYRRKFTSSFLDALPLERNIRRMCGEKCAPQSGLGFIVSCNFIVFK